MKTPDAPFAQALELMLAGMGTVFLFLALLVVAITVMSRVVRRLPQASGAGPQTAFSDEPTSEELAAATAAVHLYRAAHRSGP